MDTNKILERVPGIHTILLIVISGLFGGIVALTAFLLFVPIDLLSPPSPPHDQRFVELGRLYHYRLGKAYAAAWADGATLLDSGKSISSALESVGHSWEANRKQIFDQVLTPAFTKIIPESTKDSDVSSQARAAMSAAWRGFAIGLSK